MEEDISFETLLVPIAKGLFNQTLDGVVQTFHRTIRQPMLEESKQVRQVPLAQARHFFHGLKPATNGPTIPAAEIPFRQLHRWTRPEGAEDFLERPGSRGLQVQALEIGE